MAVRQRDASVCTGGFINGRPSSAARAFLPASIFQTSAVRPAAAAREPPTFDRMALALRTPAGLLTASNQAALPRVRFVWPWRRARGPWPASRRCRQPPLDAG